MLPCSVVLTLFHFRKSTTANQERGTSTTVKETEVAELKKDLERLRGRRLEQQGMADRLLQDRRALQDPCCLACTLLVIVRACNLGGRRGLRESCSASVCFGEIRPSSRQAELLNQKKEHEAEKILFQQIEAPA